MVTGHPEALREETPEGWRYHDKANQVFSEALQFLGADLLQIDEFIEQLEADGVPAGDELRERRQKAFKAFRAVKEETELDECAFVGHVEWILLRMRGIRKSDFVQPYINDGIKKREGDVNRTRTIVKKKKLEKVSNEQRNKAICEEYKKLQDSGNTSIAKNVAKNFPLSAKSISNIWARRNEYLD